MSSNLANEVSSRLNALISSTSSLTEEIALLQHKITQFSSQAGIFIHNYLFEFFRFRSK